MTEKHPIEKVYSEKLSRVISRYSVSFMSNTKWRKLFEAVNVTSVPMNRCVWKLVTESKPIEGHLPDARLLGDTSVGDCGALNGPFEFREIEWLMLPAKYQFRQYENAPWETISQDMQGLKSLIEAAGNFEFDLDSDGLRIYGYKYSG